MSGGSSIRAVEQDGAAAGSDAPARVEENQNADSIREPGTDAEEIGTRMPMFASPVASTIAALALIGWTVLFVMARGVESLAAMNLAGWSEAIVAWAAPALLIKKASPADRRGLGLEAV